MIDKVDKNGKRLKSKKRRLIIISQQKPLKAKANSPFFILIILIIWSIRVTALFQNINNAFSYIC